MSNIGKVGIILDKAIWKNIRDAGDAAADEVRAGEWCALLEPILDAEYPNWRTIHNYPA